MSIKASNNPFPHDPDDNFADKLDRGGYTGTAQDLKNEIGLLANPDDILVKGTIVKVGNNIAIAALAFTCRIDQFVYTNGDDYSATIATATEGYQRIDILVFTKFSTIVKIQGPEGLESAQEPDTPEGTLKIGFFTINGVDISEPEVPDYDLKEDKENKTAVVIGNENSTSLYLSIAGTISYFQRKLTDSIFGSFIISLTDKALPADVDSISISDFADSNKQKKVSLANFRNYLKISFDTFYQKIFGIINFSGTTLQLSLSDNGNKIVSTGAAAVALTIPTNAVVAFPIGSRIKVTQQGDGVITLITTGLTIVSSSALYTIKGQTITLEKTAVNTWTIEGNNLNGEIRLAAYPNTRNDGQISMNKVLGTDSSGNLKLFTIATSPPPYLQELVPDSYLPSTKGNFILKGAFFTPTMTVSIVGQTVHYVTFISDNEVHVNATTGSSEGSFNVTLNNGLSATFQNALLIVLGTVYSPITSQWININPYIEVVDENCYIKTYNLKGSAEWNKQFDHTKDFSVRLMTQVSPLGIPGSALASFTQNNVVNLSKISSGTNLFAIDRNQNTNLRMYDNSGKTFYVTPVNAVLEFRYIAGIMYAYYNNVLAFASTIVIDENLRLRVNISTYDIVGIKYIELAT